VDIGDATGPAELRRIPGRWRREPDRPRALEILNTSDDVRQAEAAIDKVYEAETRKNALLAKVLKYQKEYAQRAVPHAQKLRPPIEVVVAHYRNK
jgi:Skp family chaperone for outer membrane proteins